MTAITAVEAQAWNVFANVVYNLFRNLKADINREIMEECFSSASKN